MMFRNILHGLLLLSLVAGYSANTSAFVTVSGERFLESDGRQILFHGAAVIDKSKSNQYLGKETVDDFALMRDWGFNCIRLGIIWDGVEPEPGKYDDEYLAGVDKRIEWAAQNGIYVFLDMHQDLFSQKFSDGAPAWATLDGGSSTASEGSVWSDAYFTSQAVQTSFDNFWDNKPAPDGIGVQDHYARAWKHVAERYANNPTVIGYDLMNEPFVGSSAIMAQLLLVGKFAEALSAKNPGKSITAMEIVEKWGTAPGRSELLKELSDSKSYCTVVDAAQELFQDFDRTKLTPFFQRVSEAIREVDTKHILFQETTMASNMGVRSAIAPLKGADGKRDAIQAYAPHGYDLVTDTPDVAFPCNTRVEIIFQRHGETAKRLGMPMLVGEWGAYGMNPDALPAAQYVVSQFEKLLCGETYWAYHREMGTASIRDAMLRAYPMAIAGTLVAYSTDPGKKIFTCTWNEAVDQKGVTRLYVPASYACSKEKVQVTPAENKFTVTVIQEGSNSRYVEIPAAGKAGERSVVIKGE